MAKIEITDYLEREICKKFKGESVKIFEHLKSLETIPKKGKYLGHVGGIAIKELKYKFFRFYFVTDNYKIKFLEVSELENLLIKFVRISDKKNQQKVINEIKSVLGLLGDEGF